METSDAAQAEIEAAFLRLSAYDSSFAGRWLEGLTQAIEALETLPRRHEKIPLKGQEGCETRRMLYRNGRTAYRVVFLLIDNDDDGEEETVRILQVRSAAQFRG
ncbi:MAG: type II toxin-antitoxin system RelE/ParE family toxin [Janthinobacterium lividum]